MMNINLFLSIALFLSLLGFPRDCHRINLEGVATGYKDFRYEGEVEKIINNEEKTCNEWKLTREDFTNILQDLKLVEGVEWGALCYNLPCYYQAEICNKNEKYTMEINAGSYVILRNKNEVLYFISRKKLPYFLLECNCCEDE